MFFYNFRFELTGSALWFAVESFTLYFKIYGLKLMITLICVQ